MTPSIRSLLRALLVPACLAITAAQAAEPAAAGIAIVHGSPDGYAIDNGTVYPAGEYFALTCPAGECRLVRAQVSMPVETVGGYDGPEPMPVLRTDLATPNLFMVRGLPQLHEGPVKTWFFNERFLGLPHPADMDAAKRVLAKSVQVDGELATFTGNWVKGVDPNCGGDGCPTRALAWKFRFGATERTLATLWPDAVMGEDGLLGVDDVLLWVGDLDGDGKPDLVVRPQERPDFLGLSLYLSSQLRVGEAWRPAARFYYWNPGNPGC